MDPEMVKSVAVSQLALVMACEAMVEKVPSDSDWPAPEEEVHRTPEYWMEKARKALEVK